ncbi:hypothetical protein AB4072_07405 [Microvirga sp. 2MCAF38]|uniref:hypothetical protein n=1 Tax=Microvirga sp. 2MCAF38 TaxID=3232989 RepID=UPI003F9635FE
MLQLWKARRGRKAAVAAITPFVARTRVNFGGIPDSAWCDAYLVGFLAMLATLLAHEVVSDMRSDALGLVQAETLAELSGLRTALLGEGIFTLSLDRDEQFEEGCQMASAFYSALHSVAPELRASDPEILSLWRQYFDEHLVVIPGALDGETA